VRHVGELSRVLLLAHVGVGVLAAVAFLAPGLVALGLWLGIVPGFVLGVMPTLFLY
jgi:hypothetical protein